MRRAPPDSQLGVSASCLRHRRPIRRAERVHKERRLTGCELGEAYDRFWPRLCPPVNRRSRVMERTLTALPVDPDRLSLNRQPSSPKLSHFS